MNYRDHFAENLASLRKESGLKLQDLSEVLGITNQAISLLEKGKRSPSFEVFCAVADYFQVSLDALVGREGKRQGD